MKVYNGVSNSTVYKGLENEQDTSHSYYFNDTYTNGMQFMPMIYNGA